MLHAKLPAHTRRFKLAFQREGTHEKNTDAGPAHFALRHSVGPGQAAWLEAAFRRQGPQWLEACGPRQFHCGTRFAEIPGWYGASLFDRWSPGRLRNQSRLQNAGRER